VNLVAESAILITRDGQIGIITVNRPEVRNALNKAAWAMLRDAFRELNADAGIRVIIVTGAGEKAFVAGADLNALKERDLVETFFGENQLILQEIASIPKPVIAAINGFALGGGLELAMACDIRICASNARLGQTEINVGILPGAGGTQRLTRLVGLGKAKELIFTGKLITAEEAARIGLVNMVVEPAEVMDCALAMARDICAKSPFALRVAKLVVNNGANADLGTALTLERLGQTAVFGTEDHLEGISAFLEKRDPVYKGR
jgi:enoyl-CoA hydratase